MNPVDIIFQAASNLTGGIISDMQTAIIGMVVLLFIYLGFNILVGILTPPTQTPTFTGSLEDARMFRAARDRHEKGSEAYDLYNGLYRKHMNKTRDKF